MFRLVGIRVWPFSSSAGIQMNKSYTNLTFLLKILSARLVPYFWKCNFLRLKKINFVYFTLSCLELEFFFLFEQVMPVTILNPVIHISIYYLQYDRAKIILPINF